MNAPYPPHAVLNCCSPDVTEGAVFITSWDDGHPLDLRLAELLDKHGFAGTFFVPGRNRSRDVGRSELPVMSAQELRSLASAFEIGSHTLDHCFLSEVSDDEATRQIVEGKHAIEDVLGYPVDGFCYPGGRFGRTHADIVRSAGFCYARTIANLCTSRPSDRYQIPTTMQLYPHPASTRVSNYIRFGNWGERAGLFQVTINQPSLEARLRAALDYVCARGGIFHLWGHSWEIEDLCLWSLLDDFLRYASDRIPPHRRFDNYEGYGLASNGWRKTIVSERSGPVEIMSTGTAQISSTRLR